MDLVEAAGGEDAGEDGLGGIGDLGVLREEADLAAGVDGAVRGLEVAGDGAGQGGLAGAVAADEADAVPLVHLEADVLHQEACAHSDLQVLHADHEHLCVSLFRALLILRAPTQVPRPL